MKKRLATSLALIAGLATYSFAAIAQEGSTPPTTPEKTPESKTPEKATEPAKETTSTKLDHKEKSFVNNAFESARFTLAFSQEVQDRATNQQVKELAQK